MFGKKIIIPFVDDSILFNFNFKLPYFIQNLKHKQQRKIYVR